MRQLGEPPITSVRASDPSDIAGIACDTLVYGQPRDKPLGPSAMALDQVRGGVIAAALTRGEFRGKPNETLLIHLPLAREAKGEPSRVLLVGLGPAEGLSPRVVRNAAAAAGRFMMGRSPGAVAIAFADWVDEGWTARESADGYISGSYDPGLLKSKSEPSRLEPELTIATKADDGSSREGLALGRADWYVRDLISLPPNLLTPAGISEEAERLGQQFGFEVEQLSEARLRELGFGGVLAVGGGSSNAPTFSILRYLRGGKDAPRTALVGKGITFDAGGLSIKGAALMRTMKGDMAGAATVLGAIRAAAELELPVNLIGLVPAAENMPSGSAYRPDDVITTLNGVTVEIDNTDAEGRLLLADALAYSQRENIDQIVEISTLTVWVAIALGYHSFAVLGDPPGWVSGVLAAVSRAGERAWELPYWEEHEKQVESPIADVLNVGVGSVYGARVAGAITPVAFLRKFVPANTPWAHLDIGAAFWNDHENEYMAAGPTAIGLRSVFHLLQGTGTR